MTTNQRGIELIKSFEGCRLAAYKALPTEMFYTIGWGHYGADVGAHQQITQAEADQMLVKDLVKFEKYVETCAGHLNLNTNEFSALVSFTYNCGPGNLKKLVTGRTKEQIAEAMLTFNHAGGKELAGLTRRRQKERELFKMSIRQITIGSARIDEYGKATGGKDGDQTGKEVSTQPYYNHSKGWRCFRHKDKHKAQLIGNAMAKACENNKIGYNQFERLDIIKYGIMTDTACNCDCSSLVRACIIAAGAKDPGNFTTANEAQALLNTGEYDEISIINVELEEGDILVTKTKGHTAVITDIDDGTTPEDPKPLQPQMPKTVRKGDKCGDVTLLQICLRNRGYNIAADGDFGPKTEAAVKDWQKRNALVIDGIVGKKTWSSLGY